ncbi:MAG TPA: type II toxin-antitoxin system HicA family toxin [Candidatus Rifleibacterium sp.]|nr:type II toxin-antitoxin system HicA family toxin [Candidatus Rifleibacterium sp.]
MTSKEFKKWLTGQGCIFKPGKGDHLRVFLGDRFSVLPMHGNNQELGRGLVESIKQQLGLK